MKSGVLAFVLERMFRYGGLWIHFEHMEGVREVMTTEGQDTRAIDELIAQAQVLIDLLHANVQVRLREHHLVLGYCQDRQTIVVIDDGLN